MFEQEPIDWKGAADDVGLLAPQERLQDAGLGAQQPEVPRKDPAAVDPVIERIPQSRCAVDGREVGAARSSVFPRRGERAEISHRRGSGAGKGCDGGGEIAGCGIVPLAESGCEDQDFCHRAENPVVANIASGCYISVSGR